MSDEPPAPPAAGAAALPSDLGIAHDVLLQQSDEARKPESEEDAPAEEGDVTDWEAPLYASVELSYGGNISKENILAWSKPEFKVSSGCGVSIKQSLRVLTRSLHCTFFRILIRRA